MNLVATAGDGQVDRDQDDRDDHTDQERDDGEPAVGLLYPTW